MDFRKVKEAVEGQDALIFTIGVDSRKKTNIISEGTKNIIKAMEECGVKRLICMSSAGILGNDGGVLFGKILKPLFLRQVFLDKERQMRIIEQSSLDWVIIRPTKLTDAPKTGKYRISMGAPDSASIPRADVADFMLKLTTDKKFDRQMPAISS